MRGAMSYETAKYDETSSEDRLRYAEMCRDYRARHGLVDGLRTDQKGFADYLARRRAEDKQRRGW